MSIVSLPYIDINPDVLGGKPCIAGHRISVFHIANMHLKMGESLAEISQQYNLSLATVYAAMAYYFEHREEIECHETEMEQIVVEMERQNPPSKLQEKLQEKLHS